MAESILAVDSLAIQRSLTLLEDRYRELRDRGEQRFKKYEAELSSIKEQRDGLQQELSSIKEQRDGLQRELSTIKEQRDGLQQELSSIKEQRDGLQRELSSIQEQRDGLQHELSSIQKQRDGLQRELSSIQEQRDGLQRELSSIQEQRDGLQHELQEAKEEAELLLLQLHQVQEELEHYFLHARDLEQQLNKQSSKLSWLRSQREELIQALRSQHSLLHRAFVLNTRLAVCSRTQPRKKSANLDQADSGLRRRKQQGSRTHESLNRKASARKEDMTSQ